jgi:hypothetical protein
MADTAGTVTIKRSGARQTRNKCGIAITEFKGIHPFFFFFQRETLFVHPSVHEINYLENVRECILCPVLNKHQNTRSAMWAVLK